MHGASLVFLSHAGEDRERAYALCAALERAGVRCWLAPRDLAGGEEYASAIVRAIADSRVLLLLLSASANASTFVASEVERAASRQLPIVTVRLEDVEPAPSLELFVRRRQWIDAFGPDDAVVARAVVPCVTALLGGSHGAQEDCGASARVPPRPRRSRLAVALLAVPLVAAALVATWLATRDEAPTFDSAPNDILYLLLDRSRSSAAALGGREDPWRDIVRDASEELYLADARATRIALRVYGGDCDAESSSRALCGLGASTPPYAAVHEALGRTSPDGKSTLLRTMVVALGEIEEYRSRWSPQATARLVVVAVGDDECVPRERREEIETELTRAGVRVTYRFVSLGRSDALAALADRVGGSIVSVAHPSDLRARLREAITAESAAPPVSPAAIPEERRGDRASPASDPTTTESAATSPSAPPEVTESPPAGPGAERPGEVRREDLLRRPTPPMPPRASPRPADGSEPPSFDGPAGGELTVTGGEIKKVDGPGNWVLWGRGQDVVILEKKDGSGNLTLKEFSNVTILGMKTGKGSLTIEKCTGFKCREVNGPGHTYLRFDGPKDIDRKDGAGDLYFCGETPAVREISGTGKVFREAARCAK